MSLVGSPQLTAKKLAANRRNARKSTGPRSRQGKRRAAMNRLEHGQYARFAYHTMLALGEDPQEFTRFLGSLIRDHQPARELMGSLHRPLNPVASKRKTRL